MTTNFSFQKFLKRLEDFHLKNTGIQFYNYLWRNLWKKICFGTSPNNKELAPKIFSITQNIFSSCQDIRRSGSAALDIAHVSCGRLEAYYEFDLKPWDFAAGILILNEAGGKING